MDVRCNSLQVAQTNLQGLSGYNLTGVPPGCLQPTRGWGAKVSRGSHATSPTSAIVPAWLPRPAQPLTSSALHSRMKSFLLSTAKHPSMAKHRCRSSPARGDFYSPPRST